MRVIEREELNFIGVTDGMAYWATLDEFDQETPGPFLACVNNTGAWLGVPNERGMAIHQIHYDNVQLSRSAHWTRAMEWWLQDETVTRLELLRRYESIQRRLRRVERRWTAWDDVYPWRRGSDLLWDGLSVHRLLTARVVNGRRSVLWTGNGAWLRHWEREEAKNVK